MFGGLLLLIALLVVLVVGGAGISAMMVNHGRGRPGIDAGRCRERRTG